MSARTSADRISYARANQTRLLVIELLMPFQYSVKLNTALDFKLLDTTLSNKLNDKFSSIRLI